MYGIASVSESYFYVSGVAFEQTTRFERENAELIEKEAQLNSSNVKLTQSLEE